MFKEMCGARLYSVRSGLAKGQSIWEMLFLKLPYTAKRKNRTICSRKIFWLFVFYLELNFEIITTNIFPVLRYSKNTEHKKIVVLNNNESFGKKAEQEK
jgi:hypothetical protein